MFQWRGSHLGECSSAPLYKGWADQEGTKKPLRREEGHQSTHFTILLRRLTARTTGENFCTFLLSNLYTSAWHLTYVLRHSNRVFLCSSLRGSHNEKRSLFGRSPAPHRDPKQLAVAGPGRGAKPHVRPALTYVSPVGLKSSLIKDPLWKDYKRLALEGLFAPSWAAEICSKSFWEQQTKLKSMAQGVTAEKLYHFLINFLFV